MYKLLSVHHFNYPPGQIFIFNRNNPRRVRSSPNQAKELDEEKQPKVSVLPSAFLSSRKRAKKATPTRIYTYDRDIICLPSSLRKGNGKIKIPRGPGIREFLGKIS